MIQLSLSRTACFVGCFAIALCFAQKISAQPTEIPTPEPRTESSEPEAPVTPLDDFTQRSIVAEKPMLNHAPVREADVFWEKRIWRVIDVREKMNLPFISPNAPLFQILAKAAENGDLTVYSAEDDRFLKPLTTEDVFNMMNSRDTITSWDPDSFEEIVKVVTNEIDFASIKRFRIKEAWYFDKNTGTMNVRILGIAPMRDVTDDEGNFRYEIPLFWVHYPTARPLLARQKVSDLGDNLAATMTWEDLFEMRMFASSIYKENNVYDRRLQDYLAGTDLLLEGDKIQNGIFNFEHDLWAY